MSKVRRPEINYTIRLNPFQKPKPPFRRHAISTNTYPIVGFWMLAAASSCTALVHQWQKINNEMPELSLGDSICLYERRPEIFTHCRRVHTATAVHWDSVLEGSPSQFWETWLEAENHYLMSRVVGWDVNLQCWTETTNGILFFVVLNLNYL